MGSEGGGRSGINCEKIFGMLFRHIDGLEERRRDGRSSPTSVAWDIEVEGMDTYVSPI